MGAEAMQTLVPKYLDQVLKDKQMRMATEPAFQNLDIDQKRPFKFDVEFEVMPDFEPAPITAYKLEEKPVEVTAEQIDKRIEEMRTSRATLEDKAGPAAAGDWVTFDFEALLNGEAFPGNTGTDQRVEIGSGRYLETLENEMVGLAAGQEKSFDLPFPADYGEDALAGKTAQAKVKVSKVQAKKLPELNADLFKQFGKAETEADFRKEVDERLRAEREQELNREYQDALAEQIKAQHSFEVPESLVERGTEEYLKHEQEHHPELKDDAAKIEQLKAEGTERERGLLRLGYVLSRYATENDIAVGPEELRQRFMFQALMMRQNPEQLLGTPLGDYMPHQIQDQLLTGKTLGHMADRVLGRPPKTGAAAADAPPALASLGEPHVHDHAHGPGEHDHEHHGHDHDHDH
jgi:trigger factor